MCDSGGKQSPHFHINAAVCALYYVNFDAEKGHCPTAFTKDEASFMPHSPVLHLLKEKYTEFNQTEVVYAKEGELILFPSHTTHGYKENKGDNRAVSYTHLTLPTIYSV